MSELTLISLEQARAVGDQLGCDWTRLDIEKFRLGLETELAGSNAHSATTIPASVLMVMGCFVQARLLIWEQMGEKRDHYQALNRFENDGGISSL
ncbi:MAG: hypothetical protein MUF38_17835 [Anaerolineae bacterium]|jgi:hypothetical protein|nr:hypothetical protein [Anaerolineae bacterium]